MTQHEVAQAAGTSHSHISRIEKGHHLPTMQLLQRILAALDEELLIGIAARGTASDPSERELAPVPAVSAS
jgi:transcriptional regulator with XRE-family HTH domain